MTLRNLKRPEDALASYDRAIALKPDYAEAYYNRGNALMDLKRPEDALASYDKAIALEPDSAEAYNNRGEALRDLKRLQEHLARHRLADVFLDTLHYNAHTTASDALWAGLPVLTCIGESFAGRVAASLLNARHLPELITNTPEAYEALAVRLATYPNKLRKLKKKLANNRLTTPLFDTERLTKHIEAAYTAMYERYLAGLAPADFYVSNS